MDSGGRALVLGGGGVTGVAWETGLLRGLAELGLDLSAADVVVGTSAGSTVAAQITSSARLDELHEAQLREASGEIAAHLSPAALVRFVAASAWPGDRERARAWLGRAALRADTVPEAERRAVIEQRLPHHDWPRQRLSIPAVDAETGSVRVFDDDSGVPLVDAVAASCAVPLVWPPVTIGGRRYVDGGVRSATNADLAAGCERLVVIAPTTAAVRRADRPAAQVAALGGAVRSVIVSPGSAAKKAMGRNPLDPARRGPAARAGRAQAPEIAEQVRAVWT
ncbi:patatin-like phospholipase family protein [Saccharopolyspora sp. NFXS83]|uniref:patatin-like phospholipase family protein n=1 Tax=Saccharopolyspora sp. NFXS83 TaxID=2993560 RepID=UPI00224AEFE3|nr:patatin-like phospholipase family protein [Saccharopolyspora sp. NFXS83]MCX2730092.1 patatin-like phospholipase family protein [Saccharopolyspora sp. NFXS83]